MINMVDEWASPDDWAWVVTCDRCGYTKEYRGQDDIENWWFVKSNRSEKHFCPTCNTQLKML